MMHPTKPLASTELAERSDAPERSRFRGDPA